VFVPLFAPTPAKTSFRHWVGGIGTFKGLFVRATISSSPKAFLRSFADAAKHRGDLLDYFSPFMLGVKATRNLSKRFSRSYGF